MKQSLTSIGLVLWLAGMLTGPRASVEAQTASSARLKYEEPRYLTGAIYAGAESPGKLLFRFKRVAKRSGSTLEVERDFTYPDGRIADHERVVYQGDTLVSYELEDWQLGMAGTVRIKHSADNRLKGSIEFEYAKQRAARSKVRTEALADNTLICDTLVPFLVDHWDALSRSEKVKCRYIVLPRKETVGFTFVKDSESTWRGRRVLLVKMEPSSTLIAAVINPLIFTMEMASPHRVLQYVGRTTPKILVDGRWKDQEAVTVFDWDSAF